MSTRKFYVTIIMNEGKPFAQHINPLNGKVLYFDAHLIIKKVAAHTKNIYKVVVNKKGECTKVLSIYRHRRIKKNEIVKILKEIESLDL